VPPKSFECRKVQAAYRDVINPMNDFPTERVLAATAHRPWPMPDGPWIMTQTWNDLLFAHWPVDANELREHVPPGLELDLFDGQAYVGVVPFHMTNVAPRGVPALPMVSAFAELNVRTYVTRGGKPGVYFFSLDANSQLAVTAARTVFGLPYFTASIDVQVDPGNVAYRSNRTSRDGAPAELRARYHPMGPVFNAAPGTLEWFLTERYCLYTVDASFHAQRLEIHHPPWPLQLAAAEIETNTMASAAGLRLPSMAPLLHFARRQDMVAWAMSLA
jgi:uncharacterized protein YqjF (DUF2071 family)